MPARLPLVVLTALLTLAPPAAGQDVLEQVRVLAGQNAEGYAAPLTVGLAHALADGFVDRSRPLGALRFDLGVRFYGARLPAASETFQATLPDSVAVRHPSLGERTYADPYRGEDGALETPTIAGRGPGLVLVPTGQFEADILAAGLDPDDFAWSMPAGLALPLVPLVTMHAAMGIGVGTEVALRFSPAMEVAPELGRLRIHGAHVSHLLSRWLPLPLDVTATAGYQEATVGDHLYARATQLGLFGGTSAGPINFYGGALLRDASTEITYRLDAPDGPVALPGGGTEISFRSRTSRVPGLLLGARLQLLVMNLSGHYTLADHDVFSVKVGLGMP
jgi:hypothetical protein